MPHPKALSVDEITACCNPDQFHFETTAELDSLDRIIGQNRAIESIRFGIGVKNNGYNLFVLGPPGVGKSTAINQHLADKATAAETPSDWCYVNNFQDETKPVLLSLPTGRGRVLRNDMAQLIEDLRSAIPTAFDSEEYKARAQLIQSELQTREENAFRSLNKEATEHSINIYQTPGQFSFVPSKNGKDIPPQAFEKMDKSEREKYEEATAHLQKKLQDILQNEIPKWRKEAREKFRKLNQKMTEETVALPIANLLSRYADLPKVIHYLNAVQNNIIENTRDFLKQEPSAPIPQAEPETLYRFEVNLILDHAETQGAPVIHEEHPSYGNLIGRIEHNAYMGALTTNFTLIKPGALHKANGGYLILDARRLLMQPYAWEGLKQALYSDEIRIQSLEQVMSLGSAATLEPETMPLDIKIILLGDRLLYYLLHARDPDFAELFKVPADFEESLDRSPENDQLYARLIATIVEKHQLLPFDKYAVAAVIQQSMRLVADTAKLSTHMRSISDLLIEASHWASEAQRPHVIQEDIHTAVAHQVERVDRVRDRATEVILRNSVLIDTDGDQVGQVNGLAVYSMGNFSFGKPSRITATTRLGDGRLIDIARETKMGGPTHTKGVFILQSFMGARYGQSHALAFHGSLSFEQSYGGIDGDSASMAELCALLSSLSDIPIKQSLAITGSVNQLGQAQVIGGVNEKVEGFYDICQARGLTGTQGAIIPRSNIKNLILREDVMESIRAGKFHIYPMDNVDEAITLLTGAPAGERNTRGQYPKDSVNGKVQRRLKHFADLRNNHRQTKSATQKAKKPADD